MASPKSIAVLTAGGDAPGMNAAVRAVVRTALALGMRVVGVKRAYEGLARGVMTELGARDVGGILQRGGTVLQTARFPEFAQARHAARGVAPPECARASTRWWRSAGTAPCAAPRRSKRSASR